jgi:hypothetical protein
VIASQLRQLYFSRTVWITFQRRGTTSSVSVTLSPSFDSLPPQQGQADGLGSTTRSRGRCAGSGPRTGLPRVAERGPRGLLKRSFGVSEVGSDDPLHGVTCRFVQNCTLSR